MSEWNQLVGHKAPEFSLQGVLHQKIEGYDFPNKGSWNILLFYPLNFTFVCPTEVIAFSDATSKFKEVQTNVFGISVDSQYSHLKWTDTSRQEGGVGDIDFPLLADLNKTVAQQYGVLTEAGIALRGLFLVDDEGIIQHATVNNLGVGRSVDETLRLVQAFQFTKKSGDVCPANWQPGQLSMKPNPSGLKEYASKQA